MEMCVGRSPHFSTIYGLIIHFSTIYGLTIE